MGFCQSSHSCIIILALAAGLVGCVQPSDNGGNSFPARPQAPEKPYTGTPTSYSGATTTITASARFERYDDYIQSGGGTSANGLATMSLNNPIRYAEFHIYDATGNRIQQGETDGSGNISAVIPQASGSYSLWVNSRADNSYYRVSVLDNPYDQNFYSIKGNFALAGNEGSYGVSLPSAPAGNSTSLEGGAFNILDQVYISNQFLREKGNDGSCTPCVNTFVVAPKIPIYWTKGLSPGAYYDSPNTAISFFLNETSGSVYRGIYILGGINGSVCTDTDHFDRSVVIHEYGHFLESAYSKSASPGGSHNGNALIDPRLAWSEGWANFFQAAALGRSAYRDTVRNSGCNNGASLAFNDFNLEARQDRDVPLNNEGVFREISVSRMLYDNATGTSLGSAYNLNRDTDSQFGDVGFGIVWHTFKAMGNSAYKFQNAGLFNELMKGYLAAYFTPTQQNNHTSLLSYENQVDNQSLFGLKLIPQMSSCSFNFASGYPEPDDRSGGVIVNSDQLRTNDFFRYDYDGNPANARVTLRYTHTTLSAPYDLDLFVYKENYTFLDGSDLSAYSTVAYPEPGSSGVLGFEAINLSGKAAGTYMINVKVDYSGLRGNTNYYLALDSGARLCP